jgi:Arc/MetJ-type ribon-helix-helix transcriptional regulator
MLPEYQTRINARISKKENEELNQLIKKGKFPTKSELVRLALDFFLEKEAKRPS